MMFDIWTLVKESFEPERAKRVKSLDSKRAKREDSLESERVKFGLCLTWV